MKYYELIPIEEQNKWYNWQKTFVSYTNSRIESLINYKSEFARDYVIYNSFAARTGIDSDIWKPVRTVEEIIEKTDVTYYIMELTTDYSQATHILENGAFIKKEKTTKKEPCYIRHRYVEMIKDPEGEYYLNQQDNIFYKYEKANGQVDRYNRGFLGIAAFTPVVENGVKNSFYKEEDLNTYYEYDEKKDIYQIAKNPKDKNFLYRKVERPWFLKDSQQKGVLIFNNSCLGYREGFYNFLNKPLKILLTNNGEDRYLYMLYTIINQKLLGYGDVLDYNKYIQVVQNPLAGYGVTADRDGNIKFNYERDMGTSNRIKNFALAIGSRRFVSTDDSPILFTQDESSKDLTFVQPYIKVGNEEAQDVINGIVPDMGFMTEFYTKESNGVIEEVYCDFNTSILYDNQNGYQPTVKITNVQGLSGKLYIDGF